MKDVCDGKSWERGEVSIAGGGFVSCWVSGLPENRSALDLRVLLGEIPLQITWIGPTETGGYCQINAKVPPDLPKGPHDFQVTVRRCELGAAEGEGSLEMASGAPSKLAAQIDFAKELAAKGWYHSFELPDGTFIDGFMTVEQQKRRYAQFPIPDDLRGKTLLDIGAWDGWFSFEAERHGAACHRASIASSWPVFWIPCAARVQGRLPDHGFLRASRRRVWESSTSSSSWACCTTCGIRCWRSKSCAR